MKRTLRLQRETLTELAVDDLRAVAGASGLTCKLRTDELSDALGCVGTYQCPTYTC